MHFDHRFQGATRLGALVLLSLVLAACETVTELPPPPAGEYRLDAGDVLQEDVYGQKEFSGRFMLDTTGRISIVKAGTLELRGATLADAGALITEKLSAELRAPVLAVNIIEHRPVFVTGQVKSGGRFPYAQGLTALKAVALAGGYGPRGSRQRIAIVREDGTRARVHENTLLRPGDIVDVGESLF
jgi:polysaccharide export outer membrane protein